jgi:hypothetical protein
MPFYPFPEDTPAGVARGGQSPNKSGGFYPFQEEAEPDDPWYKKAWGAAKRMGESLKEQPPDIGKGAAGSILQTGAMFEAAGMTGDTELQEEARKRAEASGKSLREGATAFAKDPLGTFKKLGEGAVKGVKGAVQQAGEDPGEFAAGLVRGTVEDPELLFLGGGFTGGLARRMVGGAATTSAGMMGLEAGREASEGETLSAEKIGEQAGPGAVLGAVVGVKGKPRERGKPGGEPPPAGEMVGPPEEFPAGALTPHPEMSRAAKNGMLTLQEYIDSEHGGRALTVDELASARVELTKKFKSKSNKERADYFAAKAEIEAGLMKKAEPPQSAADILQGLGEEPGMTELPGKGEPTQSQGFTSEELRILKKPAFERTSEERIRLRALQAGKAAAIAGGVTAAAYYTLDDDERKGLIAAIPALAYTTRGLEALPKEGMISKGAIREVLKRTTPRKEETELFNRVLDTFPASGRIDAAEFAKRVEGELLNLTLRKTKHYGSYGLSRIARTSSPAGQQLTNNSHVWTMPVETTFENHFGDPKYFGHTREFTTKNLDLRPVRSIVEVQSDMMQRGEGSGISPEERETNIQAIVANEEAISKINAAKNLGELKMILLDHYGDYNIDSSLNFHQQVADAITQITAENVELRKQISSGRFPAAAARVGDAWYKLLLREEHRQAAKDGVRALRLGTAETIARIENWVVKQRTLWEDFFRENKDKLDAKHAEALNDWARGYLTAAELEAKGLSTAKLRALWLQFQDYMERQRDRYVPEHQALFNRYKNGMEPFVKKEFGARFVMDDAGNGWLEWDVPPEAKSLPVKQLGAAAALGTGAYLASGEEDKERVGALTATVPFFLRRGKIKEAARIAEVLSEATPKALENMIEKVKSAEAAGNLTHEEVLERLYPIRKALRIQKGLEARGVDIAKPEDTKPLERGTKTNLRNLGLSARDLGLSPRDMGTNPRAIRDQEGAVWPSLLTAMYGMGGAALVGGITGNVIADMMTKEEKDKDLNKISATITGAVAGAMIALTAMSPKDTRLSLRDFGSREFRLGVERGKRAIFQLSRAVEEAVPTQARRAAISDWLARKPGIVLSQVEQTHANAIKQFFDGLVTQGVDPAAVKQAWEDYNAALQPKSPMGMVLLREGPLATRDAATILGIFGNSLIMSLERKKLLEILRATNDPTTGIPFAVAVQKAPGSYVPQTHPQYAGWAVHPDLAAGLKFTEGVNNGAIIRGLQFIAESSKSLLVSLSEFHLKNLIDVVGAVALEVPKTPKKIGFAAAGALVGYGLAPEDNKAITSVAGLVAGNTAAALWDIAAFGHLKMMRTGGLGDKVDQALKGGVKLTFDQVNQSTIDQASSFFAGMRQIEKFVAKASPGLSKVPWAVRKVAEYGSRFLWPWVHTGMKLWTFDRTFSALKEQNARRALKNPALYKSDDALGRIAGDYTNSLFGGLDWMAAAEESTTRWGRDVREGLYNPQARSYLNLGMFAMDWTVSTTRAWLQALPIVGATDKDLRALHLSYVAKGLLYYVTTADAINYAQTGHHIWQNKDPTLIENAEGQQSVWSKHTVEPYHWGMRPGSQAMNKLSGPVKEGIEQILGVEWLSPKGAPRFSQVAKEKDVSQANERLMHALKSFYPISMESSEESGYSWRNFLGMQTFGKTEGEKEELKEKRKQRAKDVREGLAK